MKTFVRGALFAVLAVGLVRTARGADDARKLESTPQAKVYRASLKAMKAGDYEAYKKCMMKAAIPQMEEQAKEMKKSPKEVLEFLSMLTPTDITLTALKVDGKKATMTATGKQDGEVNKGTIELAEEDGQWKVGHQSWTNAK